MAEPPTEAGPTFGALSCESSRIGRAQHLAVELLKHTAMLDVAPVLFLGGALAFVALTGDRVDCFIINPGVVSGRLRDGFLQSLAVADDDGHPSFDAPRISASVLLPPLLGWIAACVSRSMPREAVDIRAKVVRAGGAEATVG